MSRLYIRVMTGFYTHRKTVRLFAKIGSDAFWLPLRIWAYCAENQPDGDLSGYGADELAMLVAYKGDACSMLVALKDCGFMDSEGMVHDWKEHNGYHEKFSVRAKTAAKARWEQERKEAKERSTEKEKRKVDKESGDKHCLEHATSMLRASPNIDDVLLECQFREYRKQDGEDFFNHFESLGWNEGKQPVIDWKLRLCKWVDDLASKAALATNARIALHVLNNLTGSKFRECDSSLSPIMTRLSEPDVTIDGVKMMIERQVKKWKGTEYEDYLRPSTLFGKEKFNSYYASREQPIIKSAVPSMKPNHDNGF